MDNRIALGPTEIPTNRAFTDPQYNAADLAALAQMAARLRWVLAAEDLAAPPEPLVLNFPEPDGRPHRVVVAHLPDGPAAQPLPFVGFFGQKRPEAALLSLSDVDDKLIAEFPQHPDVLTYSSIELADGNWGNLVLLRSEAAREHWRISELHAYAVRELAPPYYATIRLHNGLLPAGLASEHAPVLLRTKYYDYRGAEPWRAVREYDQP
jgi:hypothetical protein